ncbi:MAG: NTP transferase domain-containing protein [Phycisphaerae bacterium]|nr:NTP transferase domain-containing protein [Phycisphaerae bacterium]MDP7637260.1 NTP transferase domain-containing protein [Phycisphaerae bacterium]
MDNTERMACVILAGGGGKRMASADLHKVCFPIVGRPAIVRAIDAYKAAGLRRFLIVVGQKAAQVIAAVSQAHPEVSFVYQIDPRGTGHAAAVAAEALVAQGHTGQAMIVMGDKMTRPSVICCLLERFEQRQPDVLVATLPKAASPTSGRVIMDAHDTILGIVEVVDIDRARRTHTKVQVGGLKLTPAQTEKRSNSINASMYVFRFEALNEALEHLESANAQGELYLTDTVEYISRTGRAEAMSVDVPTELMGFNTPAELLAIEQVVSQREKPPRVSVVKARRLSPRVLKPAANWLSTLESDPPKWRGELRRTYGANKVLLTERRKAIRRLVTAFIRQYGRDREMILCRTPGRINLMGRHVDHRGGFVNVMAISREVLLAAAPRQDDVVSLRNVEPKRFPFRQFRIFDLLQRASWSDWIDFVNSRAVRRVLDSAQGDWSHYARAPLLRLQHECRDVRLKGMDCMVSGSIPIGAGLSSSSALVMAFAEAMVVLNRLNVTMRDFIDICGEGEWFVGSRGGSAEHAAIRTARIGHISRITFFPFRRAGEERFPRTLQIVVAYSGAQAAKSAGAGDMLNQRLACFDLAEILLRRHWPAAAGMEHLRDLAPHRLKVKSGEIYRALMRLPVRPSRRHLLRILPKEDHDRLEEIFATHANLGNYDLRGVALFGLSEILRSRQFAEAIRKDDLDHVAQLMRDSHNGDRRVRFDQQGKPHRHVVRTDDASLERLAAGNADLARQCGRYACSTEAIDHLVDIAEATQGVVGAQLAGAGPGGCMMILVRTEALDLLMRRLRRDFYRPRGLDFTAHVCSPVAGAGLLGA